MSLALATTWRPHGEMPRLQQLRPFLRQLYSGIAVVLPAGTDPAVLHELDAMPEARRLLDTGAFQGRYLALKEALNFQTTHIQYIDMDRLIRWAETRPDELQSVTQQIQQLDCLILGRSKYAFNTHPACLRVTESSVNDVFSFLLGQGLDLCSGSKAFSRSAVAHLIGHSDPDCGTGSDAEWPVLLQKAGFALTPTFVDGLDWETADRNLPRAATAAEQRHAADELDKDPESWRFRANLAREIIKAGLTALASE